MSQTTRNLKEEGEEEYAAYHQGTGHEEAHAEEVQLVQSLINGEAGGVEGTTAHTSVVPFCKTDSVKQTQSEPCARDVLSFMEFAEEFGHEAEHLYHAGKRVVEKILHHIKFKTPGVHDFECAGVAVGVGALILDAPPTVAWATGTLTGLGCAAVSVN